MENRLAHRLSESISAFCRANMNQKNSFPIRSSEMGALIYITLNADSEGVLAVELSEYFGIRKSSVAAMISSLTKEGYIKQTVSEFDKRSKPLFPTEKGEGLVDEALDEYHGMSLRLLEAMGTEKCQQFLALLNEATTIVQKGGDE